VKDKNNRPQYQEVPTSIENILDGSHEQTIAERKRQFAESDDEFSDFDKSQHRKQVKMAMAMGKPVRPEVLADYPDIAPKKPVAKPEAQGTAPEAGDDGDDWPETKYTPEESAKHRDSAISKGLDRVKATPHVLTGAQAEAQAQNAWHLLDDAQKAQFSGFKEFGGAVGKAFVAARDGSSGAATAKPATASAHPFAQSAMKGKIREASGQKLPGEESSSSWYETGKINNYSDEDIQKFYLGRALQSAGKLTAKDFEKGFDSAINSAVSRGDVTDKIASAASAAFDRGKQQAGSKPKPAPATSSFVPEMIPGQQASLFGGDDLNTGQKSLFNMVRPTKADQRAANRGAGPAPASLLEQIDDEQRKVADSRKSLPGQRDLLGGDETGAERQPHEMTKAEYERQVSQIKPKPTEYLNVGKTMVIQNPTPDDHRFLSSQAREKFPNMPKGEAVVRKTKDKKGNQYIWMAHEATHGMIEPEISKIVGEDLNQNHDIPTHKDHLREALRTGMKIPKAVQDEYPQYADLFNNGGKYSAGQVDRFIERYRASAAPAKKADTKPKTVTGKYGDRGRFITVGEGDAARPVFLPGSVKKIKETGEYRTDNSRAKAQADRKKAKARGGGKFVPVSKVEKAIVSTVGDHPTDVKEFSTIVEQVYREKSEIVRDKIAAIREITAMAGYDRKNAGGFIRSIRAAGDYDKIPRFDEMADYARRKYPHILSEAKGHGNSHEDALFAILKEGIPEMPNKDDEDVMNAAWERSGYDQTGKPSEWESSDGGSQDEDDFVPFAASLAARMSIERYRANPRAFGAPQFMRSR